ncbi:MAG: ATP-dependent Clp protease ATP-binding subunit [Oscillospiraceae bacterium]
MLCSRCKKRPAVVFMTRMEGEKSVNEGLCLVCAKELGLKPIDDLMKRFGISDEDLEAFSEQFAMPGDEGSMENGDGADFESGGSPTFPNFFQNILGNMNKQPEVDGDDNTNQKQSRRKEKSKPEESKRKFLDNYCDNLSKKAREGKLDRIIGRDKEIYRTIQILSRRQKNNPCLIGEAGVGKTAIAEGIALRIESGDVPAKMRDKEVYLLDLTSLVAGTQFRGQFESRVKGLISEVKSAGNIILFIDEIHNLTGAGDADGAMSAANILKPALSRGEIQVIGATTFAEYRKYIEKDQALERRFQPVKIEEPSIEDTVEMLKGIKEYYEKYHFVKVSDATVELIVALSERYISDRFLPDKAIDLLDEAAACRSLRCPELAEYQELSKKSYALQVEEKEETESEEPDYEKIASLKSEGIKLESRMQELLPVVSNLEVETDDLSKVIELWTGIPASKIQKSEYKKVSGIEAAIKEKIIGQDEAVAAVANAIKRSRVGLSKRRRPASFIFVGPTGVGKTELVKVLATELFDSVDPLIRLDMSEYMEKHAVARLIGSPPGYVGYDEAGQLTEKVRRRPYSVILFDEIEKAHPDVMNILLQILDEGRVTDGQGRTVNFENTVICMTSNAGSNDKTGLAGFGMTLSGMNSDKTLKALNEFLRPEFVARVDEVVVFNPLTDESMKKIAALMLDEMREPLLEKLMTFSYDDDVLDELAKLSDGGKFGARDLRRTIRKVVEDKVAELIVNRSDNPPKSINLSVQEGKIVIEGRD